MDKQYFEGMKAQMKEFRQRMKDEGETFFKDLAKELFEKNPELLKFSWYQYTPYFNDGDPCIFSANIDYPNILLSNMDEEIWLDDEPYFDDGTKESEILDSVIKFLSQFDDSDFEMLFDDHSRIIVGRDEIVIEEYSHD